MQNGQNKIYINEIFGPTIQGEGPHAGMKCNFIRVACCDFSCSWCDTKSAWTRRNSMEYESEELGKKLKKYCLESKTSNIVLTGGNPCIYDFKTVVTYLKEHRINVDVETQGSLLPEWLKEVNLIVFSPKPPSSGMKDVYNKLSKWLSESENLPKVCIKIPIFNDEDIEFAHRYYDLVKELKNKNKDIDLYLSVGNTDTSEEGDISSRVLSDYKLLIKKICDSDFDNVFILPQIHTLVWGNKPGV